MIGTSSDTRQCRLRRRDRFLQALQRQRLQRVELVRTEAEMLQHGFGQARRALALGKAHTGAALNDRLVEESHGARHRQQRARLSAAAGLAEDRDVARIAAEALGVLAHPLQRRHQIEKAGIAGLGEALAADLRQIKVTEDIQPMVDGYDHDVVASREIGAVVARRVGGAVGESATVQPNHDRTLRIVESRCPDMQRQAVLADGQHVDRSPNRGQFRALRSGGSLWRTAGIDGRLAHTDPRFGLAWRHETVGAGGRGAIGNTLEDVHAFRRDADDAA
jgi:hypothetical protein